jgi:Spy/CpxP family protein refolding chaperone
MADYATVLAEVKKLSAEDLQTLLKAIKKPRAAKAQTEGDEKPKRVLTDEQKAKMKAGREAAKARREAEKGAAGGGEPAKPAKKPRAAKAKTEDGAEGAEKPKRVLTDEQKAKMKAGREAAKARKAAEADAAAAGGVPALAAAPGGGLDLEEVPVELVDWEHDFGTGAKLYKLLSYEGTDYVYDHESREYLGAYVKKTNKIKKSMPNPLSSEED